MRRRLRTACTVLLLVLAIGTGPASAREVAIVRFEHGYEQRIEIFFDGSRIEAGAVNITGPHVTLYDEAPYLTTDPSGRGGAWLTLEENGDVVCALTDGTPGWSLTVDEFASSATLTSTVPGCAGTIQLTGDGMPGFGVSIAPFPTPGPHGTDGSAAITISRAATVTGSFAGPITEVYSATISYTRVYEPGGGIPI
jgi:hypothetical protein